MTDEEKRKREEEERRMRELYERSQQAKINPPTGSNNAGIEEGSSFGQPENDEGTIKGGAKGTLLNGVEGYDNITKPAEKSEPQELSGYQKVLEAYKKRQMLNEALDARGQSRSVVAGIGDLARSLANLYYVNRYAPNAYDPTKTMTARQREIFEKAKANRDANLDQWMHYVLNVAGKKQAEEQAEKTRQDTKDYRDAVLKQNAEKEQRLKDKFEFEKQKEDWKRDFESQKLNQKEQLAKMNADLKRWTERLKMSRSEVAHTLAGYTIDEYQYFDDKKRLHKVKVRTVYNPKTEQLEAEQSDEVTTTQSNEQQTTGQSGVKWKNQNTTKKNTGVTWK